MPQFNTSTDTTTNNVTKHFDVNVILKKDTRDITQRNVIFNDIMNKLNITLVNNDTTTTTIDFVDIAYKSNKYSITWNTDVMFNGLDFTTYFDNNKTDDMIDRLGPIGGFWQFIVPIKQYTQPTPTPTPTPTPPEVQQQQEEENIVVVEDGEQTLFKFITDDYIAIAKLVIVNQTKPQPEEEEQQEEEQQTLSLLSSNTNNNIIYQCPIIDITINGSEDDNIACLVSPDDQCYSAAHCAHGPHILHTTSSDNQQSTPRCINSRCIATPNTDAFFIANTQGLELYRRKKTTTTKYKIRIIKYEILFQ
eukprot:UN02422